MMLVAWSMRRGNIVFVGGVVSRWAVSVVARWAVFSRGWMAAATFWLTIAAMTAMIIDIFEI